MKSLVLIILDGWGYSKKREGNAIYTAHTPVWDELWSQYPHALLSASGVDVGLPKGQMGNSEVGHLHIGAGRLLLQDLTRFSIAIKDGNFFKNPVLVNATKKTAKANKSLHILGLLSPGGVHSHEKQLHAMAELAAKNGIKQLYVHAILDGRDTPPKSALKSLETTKAILKALGHGKIASIIGRYYAMDRDKRWNRTEKAYNMLTQGKAEYYAKTATEGLSMAYARGETDEFVKPTCIYTQKEKPITINNGDTVIFMNFRADRARQLTRAFTEKNFDGFKRKIHPKLNEFVTLTLYANDIHAKVAYPPIPLPNVFSEYIAKQGLTQLHIAETEKYAHVTYFFNGGREEPFKNEDRKLIPSPKVATYDLKPEMSAIKLTNVLTKAIISKKYNFIVCNYANPDMIGHTGNFDATVKAIEIIDTCLGHIHDTLKSIDGDCLITADHGNAEHMYDNKTKQPHTAHTNELVPLLYIGEKAKFTSQTGGLIDLAPTMLYLLGLKLPLEMTGKSLLE